MAKMKAGYIGFSFGMPAEETDAFYAKTKEIGYQGTENLGMMLRSADDQDAIAKIKATGLTPLTLGWFFRDGVSPDPEDLIRRCQAIGCNRVTCMGGEISNYKFLGKKEKPTFDEIRREIDAMEETAVALDREGIVMAFHNHDWEFTMAYEGLPAYYHMIANSEKLKFLLDCGWATYGGVDPVKLINDLGPRIAALHIKDFIPGEITNPQGVSMPRFTTPGTGKLDIHNVLKAGVENNVEWAIVEQDFMYNLSPIDTLTAAYLNMKETGYVE